MRRTLPLVLALVLTCLGVAWTGDASGAGRAASSIEITKAVGDTEHVQVRGKVTSAKDRCLKNRRVRVYHDVAPPGPSAQDFMIGETRTADNGKWDVASVALPDKVYAVVKKNKRCKGDTSDTVDVIFK
jgi:hypothetical protein